MNGTTWNGDVATAVSGDIEINDILACTRRRAVVLRTLGDTAPPMDGKGIGYVLQKRVRQDDFPAPVQESQ